MRIYYTTYHVLDIYTVDKKTRSMKHIVCGRSKATKRERERCVSYNNMMLHFIIFIASSYARVECNLGRIFPRVYDERGTYFPEFDQLFQIYQSCFCIGSVCILVHCPSKLRTTCKDWRCITSSLRNTRHKINILNIRNSYKSLQHCDHTQEFCVHVYMHYIYTLNSHAHKCIIYAACMAYLD